MLTLVSARQYRGLVRAVSLAARTADRRSRQRVRHRADARCSARPMCSAAPSARSCRARTCSASACSTPGCRACWSAVRSRPWPKICFAAQWAIILHQLGTMTGADTIVNVAWVIVPLIVIAECFSWHAVLTTKYLYNADREFDLGRRLLHHRRRASAGCCRSSTARCARSWSSRSSGSRSIWRS